MYRFLMTFILTVAFHCAHATQLVPVDSLAQIELEAILKGTQPDVAIEFTKNTCVPLNLFIKGDFLKTEGQQEVEIVQTFYLRVDKEEIEFSKDLMEWKPFTEFFTGTFSFSCSASEGYFSMKLGAELNHLE